MEEFCYQTFLLKVPALDGSRIGDLGDSLQREGCCDRSTSKYANARQFNQETYQDSEICPQHNLPSFGGHACYPPILNIECRPAEGDMTTKGAGFSPRYVEEKNV